MKSALLNFMLKAGAAVGDVHEGVNALAQRFQLIEVCQIGRPELMSRLKRRHIRQEELDALLVLKQPGYRFAENAGRSRDQHLHFRPLRVRCVR
jgi:hypothetical protein